MRTIEQDVKNMVLDAINDERLTDMNICDIHNEVFNTDYFIIGTYEAKKYLEAFGVFEAIEIVRDYEVDNFGECNTDLSDPEKIVNMLAYIKGEEFLNSLVTIKKNWNEDLIKELEIELKSEIEAI
jgi:hypothetical protein